MLAAPVLPVNLWRCFPAPSRQLEARQRCASYKEVAERGRIRPGDQETLDAAKSCSVSFLQRSSCCEKQKWHRQRWQASTLLQGLGKVTSQVRDTPVLRTTQGLRPRGFCKQRRRPLGYKQGGRRLLPRQLSWPIPRDQREGVPRGRTTSQLPSPLPGSSNTHVPPDHTAPPAGRRVKVLAVGIQDTLEMRVHTLRYLCGTAPDKPVSVFDPYCLGTKT